MRATCLIGAALCAIAGFDTQAEEIPLEQVPQTVRQSFQKLHPQAGKVEVEYEANEYGEPLYEFKFRQDGKKVKVLYHTDGSLFGYERELPVSALPEAVRRSVERLFPGERIDFEEAEGVYFSGVPLAYEVEVETAGDREWKIFLNADGSVTEKRPD